MVSFHSFVGLPEGNVWNWSIDLKILFPRNGHSSRITMSLSRGVRDIFCDLHVYLVYTEPMLGNNVIRFIHHLPNCAKLSRITSWQPFKHVASITESGWIRTCCRLVCLQGLLGHPVQNALWLSPAPWQKFRENIPIRKPKPSAGGNASTRSLGAWLSQSFTFGSLAAVFGACFLRLHRATFGNTSDSPRCASGLWPMVFGCGDSGRPAATDAGKRERPMSRAQHHTGNWTRTKPKFSGTLLLPDPQAAGVDKPVKARGLRLGSPQKPSNVAACLSR